MPFFSFKRSSASKAVPLNEGNHESNGRGIRRNRSFVGKLRNPAPVCVGGRRSRSRSPPPPPPPSSSSSESSTSGSSWSVPLARPRRRGTTFCGCCDMRIATAFLNTIHMAVSIAVEIQEARKWGNRNYLEEPPIMLFLVMVASGLGLFGALHFVSCSLVLSTCCFCLLWYMYLIEMHIFGLLLISLIMFAQLVLADEMRRGVMSEENYLMEEFIDPDGRKVIEGVHSLSIDIGETAIEFAQEVKRQSSRGKDLGRTPEKIQQC